MCAGESTSLTADTSTPAPAAGRWSTRLSCICRKNRRAGDEWFNSFTFHQIYARVDQLAESAHLKRVQYGFESRGEHHALVSQLGRGICLKNRMVWVRIPPRAPDSETILCMDRCAYSLSRRKSRRKRFPAARNKMVPPEDGHLAF